MEEKQDQDFDVAMGSYVGVEVCEFVGLFLLNELSKLIPNDDIGLYEMTA